MGLRAVMGWEGGEKESSNRRGCGKDSPCWEHKAILLPRKPAFEFLWPLRLKVEPKVSDYTQGL